MKHYRKLSQHEIDTAKPKDAEYTLWDPLYSGFGLRIRPSGSKSFVLLYRAYGRNQRRITIGKATTYTLKEARRRAVALLRQVEDGFDPATEKATSRNLTVGQVYPRYRDDRLSELSSGHRVRVEGIFKNRILPVIRNKPIGTISRADVRDIVSRVNSERKPSMANNVHRVMSAFLSWCYLEEIIVGPNPLLGIPLPNRCPSRDRVLSPYEMAVLWFGCLELSSQWGAGVQLLMLTGLRRSEVFGAQLDEIDPRTRTWTIPGTRTKNRHQHRVCLSNAAMRVIEGLHIHNGQKYLLQSEFTKQPRPITGNTSNFRKLQKLVEPEARNWCIHDIRRSVATHMAELGVEPHVIEVVLNHRSGFRRGVTAIYNRYSYNREVIKAWVLWGETLEKWIESIDELRPDNDVII